MYVYMNYNVLTRIIYHLNYRNWLSINLENVTFETKETHLFGSFWFLNYLFNNLFLLLLGKCNLFFFGQLFYWYFRLLLNFIWLDIAVSMIVFLGFQRRCVISSFFFFGIAIFIFFIITYFILFWINFSYFSRFLS